jgi:formylglycine-generating enzyme required for sulfatase activity
MVEVPAGTLKMGSNETPPREGYANLLPPEFPEHPVAVPGFYLDRTEVTNRAFLAFLKATGREAWGKNIWPKSGGQPDPKQLDWPVTRVTYAEAVEFAAWRGCCLPDESQLEWAARGPSGLQKPADGPVDGPPPMWSQLHAVPSDPRDQTLNWAQPLLGLFGNASELTLFRFRPYPNVERMISGSSARFGFVVRSGVFLDSRSAKPVLLGYIKRASLLPEVRNDFAGFRCARSKQPRIVFPPQPFGEE